MAEKINVDSGNPYRDAQGHFGTSPDEKLKASFAKLQSRKLVTHEDNQKKIKSARKEAKEALNSWRKKETSDPNQMLNKREDVDTHRSKVEALDPSKASQEDIDYLNKVITDTQDALDIDKFPYKRRDLTKLLKEASFKLGNITDTLDKKAPEKPNTEAKKKDVIWKPSGTAAEAKEFVKDSEFKPTLYHGTTQTSASKIGKTGFAVGKKSKRGDTNFPGTIMLTDNEKDAAWYGRRAGGDDGTVRPYSVLSMKLNSTSHKKFTDQEWMSFMKGSSVEEKIDAVFAENDSFEIKDSFGSTNVVIKDPKKLMVFNNDKR